MNIPRFIFPFLYAGVLIPVVFQILWWLVGNYPAIERSVGYALQKLMLMVWPSSFMMLAASQESLYFGLLFASILVNVLIYAVVGFAVLYGLKNNYLVIVLLLASLLFLWWNILML